MKRNHTQDCHWPPGTHRYMHLYIHVYRNTQNENKISRSTWCGCMHTHTLYMNTREFESEVVIKPNFLHSQFCSRTNRVYWELDNPTFQRGKYMGTTQGAWELLLTKCYCNHYLFIFSQRTQNQHANKAILLPCRHGSETIRRLACPGNKAGEAGTGRPGIPELPFSPPFIQPLIAYDSGTPNSGTNSMWSLPFPTCDISVPGAVGTEG